MTVSPQGFVRIPTALISACSMLDRIGAARSCLTSRRCFFPERSTKSTEAQKSSGVARILTVTLYIYPTPFFQALT